MKTKLLTKIFIALAVLFVVAPASSQTPVEVKLQAFLEEDRGWCLDLRGPAIRAAIKAAFMDTPVIYIKEMVLAWIKVIYKKTF